MADITAGRAGELVGSHRRHGRRYTTYSQMIGGGLVANVVDGTLVGFGMEPCTNVLIDTSGRVNPRDRRHPMLVWAAPLAGAAAAAGAVATGVVMRHWRVA